MGALEYRFTNDVLFKFLFVKNPDLLKRLIAGMLSIELESITEFEVTNPDILPESFGEKFCRLDISMRVDGRKIGLEVQVANEGNYPERSLYYWAREYSSALRVGADYSELPQTILISILGFKLFNCIEYFSEYKVLETARHNILTDKFNMQFYELPKLPELESTDDELKFWLTLFNSRTEEDLNRIESIGGSVMKQAIGAYRTVTATDNFKELERLRHRAHHDEVSALNHARREEREKWEGVVAEHVAEIADKEAEIADKEAENESLRKQIAELLAKGNE
jgi:predicted transposase/invertase (TIGR01784 family)